MYIFLFKHLKRLLCSIVKVYVICTSMHSFFVYVSYNVQALLELRLYLYPSKTLFSYLILFIIISQIFACSVMIFAAHEGKLVWS